MFGHEAIRQADYALSSMHLVGEALRKANIPRSLIVFATHAIVINDMNKKAVSWQTLAHPDKLYKANNNGTDIAKAINQCQTQLNTIRAKRKIMIILTDGSSDIDEMTEAHKQATNEGIECIAIAINRDSYEYGTIQNVFSKEKTTIIDDTRQTEKIGQAFIDVLETSVKLST
jgi:uncharacterized protein with von Willebrand factor type A (vWA) domain